MSEGGTLPGTTIPFDPGMSPAVRRAIEMLKLQQRVTRLLKEKGSGEEPSVLLWKALALARMLQSVPPETLEQAKLRHGGSEQDASARADDNTLAEWKPDLNWIATLVEHLLEGIPHRTGGSLGAKQDFNAPRSPKDIDLEFWTWEDAMAAGQRLKNYEKAPIDPRVAYFNVEPDKAQDSVTATAYVYDSDAERLKKTGRPKMTAFTIELNNENARQGDRDFKKTPNTRYSSQPDRMRRNSLIAGVLERYSYTLVTKEKEDKKQDLNQLKHLIGSASGAELKTMRDDVMSRFDEKLIKNPPPLQDHDSDDDSDDEEIDHNERMKRAEAVLEGLIRERQGNL